VIPIHAQLEYYKQYQRILKEYQGEAKAKETIREALHVISLGANDFIENYFVLPIRSSQFTVSEYEDFLISIAGRFVRDLYELGARKIGIVGLPPIGCVPLERIINVAALGQCREEINDAARDFTVKEQQLVARLNTELSGLTLVLGNVFDLGIDVIANPSAYGECNTTNIYNFFLI
jgi:GDSL-like Lipase/Acylhydrolase